MDEDFVYVDENHRLGWGYDEYADNPREDWDIWIAGFVTIEGQRGYADVTPVFRDRLDLESVHQRFGGGKDYIRSANREAAELTVRWARIFHDTYVEYDSEFGGYWFIDADKYRENWPDGNGPSGKDIVEGERKAYSDWAHGYVYYVFAEKRDVEHVTVTDPLTGKVLREYDRETWERTDQLHGIYMDDESYGPTFEKMVAAVARDNFGDEYTVQS